ncbi:hypothetical protein [Cellulomonas sp. RIT-PI-Y]|uniref:hypothetical protein n=1 Tax=Cellulomonas sp. RIT-PI-Y TaxID=3035297 RepID=UPI0021D93D64|nr:hypothetical protein [Cellulomonas sp. RIT-PI-Y]
MPVGTGEFELTLGVPLDREAVCQLFAPHAPVVEGDAFWDLTDLEHLPVVCAELYPTPTGTFVSGLVRPGLDGAELLALARAVACDAGHDVLIEDVTFRGDCPDHLLVVHPDGALDHAIDTSDGRGSGHTVVDLDPHLVQLPEPGALLVRLQRRCGAAHAVAV